MRCMACGRNDLLSLSVEQGMIAAYHWKCFSFRAGDVHWMQWLAHNWQLLAQCLSLRYQAVQFRAHNRACLPFSIQMGGIPLLDVAPQHATAYGRVNHHSMRKHLQQLFADVEGCQPSEEESSTILYCYLLCIFCRITTLPCNILLHSWIILWPTLYHNGMMSSYRLYSYLYHQSQPDQFTIPNKLCPAEMNWSTCLKRSSEGSTV